MLKFIFFTLLLAIQVGIIIGFVAAVGLSDHNYFKIYVMEFISNFIISFFVYKTIYKKFVSNLTAYPWYWKLTVVSSPVWITFVIGIMLIFVSDYIF